MTCVGSIQRRKKVYFRYIIGTYESKVMPGKDYLLIKLQYKYKFVIFPQL